MPNARLRQDLVVLTGYRGLACEATTALRVPLLFTAWGALCWFAGFRLLFSDPETFIRKIAETRSKSRLLHPRGGGDPQQEFDRQWKLRPFAYIAVVGYATVVAGAWVQVTVCGSTGL